MNTMNLVWNTRTYSTGPRYGQELADARKFAGWSHVRTAEGRLDIAKAHAALRQEPRSKAA